MLVVETVARIRREFFVKGKSIKEIVRDLGVSRNTVRKVLRSGETAFAYERSVQPLPKLGPWSADLKRLLEANGSKARRERLTMIRLFEELQGLGYRGGYDAVRRYAAGWHRDRSAATAAAYVPLSFAPGEAYQFDWSHEVVLIGGVTTTVKVAHLRLCHSRMFYVRAYPRESQEMVFDAHDRAFAFLGGACQRGIYDNMKTAVDAIFVGRERRYNRRFEQMCGHYLVEPVACTPASGWEKGQVENQVGLVRERFFTPRLRFKSYEEMNGWLADRCVAHAQRAIHPELKDRTVWEVYEAADRPALIAYRGPFDGFHALPASVSKTLLVRFDHNKYSVHAKAAGRPVRQVGATREADDGRDFIVEWAQPPSDLVTAGISDGEAPFLEQRDVIVQVKIRAQGVGRGHLPGLRDTLEHYRCSGLLVVAYPNLTTTLTDHLTALRREGQFWVDWWNRAEIDQRVRRFPDVAARYPDLLTLSRP